MEIIPRQSSSPVKNQKRKYDNQLMEDSPSVLALNIDKVSEKQIQQMLSWLRYWNRGNQKIVPVTVCSHFEMGWLMSPSSKQAKEALGLIESHAKEKWSHLLGESPIKALLSEEGENSNRAKAQKIIEFSRRLRAGIIVTTSRAQSRTELIGIGSFTETLISLSSVPVLVLGEDIKEAKKIEKIFFPSDLAHNSKKTFAKVVRFAQKLKASIVLFHYLNMNQGPAVMGIPWGYEIDWIDRFWLTHEKNIKKEGNDWCKWAESKDVKCELIIDRDSGPLRSKIVEAAKKDQADLICLDVRRGPMSQVIMGRTTRGVLAHGDCPVLAIHSVEGKGKHSGKLLSP